MAKTLFNASIAFVFLPRLGDRHEEMFTLINYKMQSFSCWECSLLRPFYNLISCNVTYFAGDFPADRVPKSDQQGIPVLRTTSFGLQ